MRLSLLLVALSVTKINGRRIHSVSFDRIQGRGSHGTGSYSLPNTARGNKYVLMAVDQFTAWVECISLPTQTAVVTAYAAVNTFLCWFVMPV